jgi:hypothetical protein
MRALQKLLIIQLFFLTVFLTANVLISLEMNSKSDAIAKTEKIYTNPGS